MLRAFSSFGAILTPEESIKHHYVIDTSTLLSFKESIHSLPDSFIYLPIEVLEELDTFKTKKDLVGVAARYLNRFLDQVRENGNLTKGITLDNGAVLTVVLPDFYEFKDEKRNSNDNKIIYVAKKIQKNKGEATVISEDIALRIRCDAFGLKAISYQTFLDAKIDKDYTGVRTLEISRDEVDLFYREEQLYFRDEQLYPNQGVILKSGQSSALGLAIDENTVCPLKYTKGKNFNIQGISPRSKEQTFALELLLDPEVSLVTLTGCSGVGKTVLATAAALYHLDKRNYRRLIISRPAQSLSKDIGYLPGLKEEKLKPWVQPIIDNFNFLTEYKGKEYFEMLMEKGIIEFESLSFIRGRTLPDTIFIIDEAQNITYHEAKALLTRMGENSKIILLGDLEQIDAPHLNEETSGLFSAIELFKDFERAGHIKLIKGERSELATYASKVM